MQGGIHINRAQKRKMMKKLGVDYQSMNLITETVERKFETMLNDGDKVMIDVEAIVQKPKFASMQDEYQEFIRNSEGKIFTVVKEDRFIGRPIVSLAEDSRETKWLFWEGELKKVQENAERMI